MKKQSKIKEALIILFVMVALIASIILLTYERKCDYDQNCFNKAAEKCYKASFLKEEDSNILKYQIIGKEGDSCKIRVTITKVNPLADYETKQLFQGKHMECKIPKDTPIAESKEIIEYCSGPLKEAIYELIIKKMYNYIAQNIGEIISSMESV